nr:exocyst complex component SEC10B-like isoform X1 [Tanacetum cinerariifolium]
MSLRRGTTEVHGFGMTFLGYWVKYKVTSMIGHVSRILLPVDGAHAASCEEMATPMSSAEGAAYKGLQQCIETIMAEGNRLHKGLSNHWQKYTFNPRGFSTLFLQMSLRRGTTEVHEFGMTFLGYWVKYKVTSMIGHVYSDLPTLFRGFCYRWMVHMLLHVKKWQHPCPVQKVLPIKDFNNTLRQLWPRVVAYLTRVLDATFTALEGLNKQTFLTELGNRLHKGLSNHWQKYTFNPSPLKVEALVDSMESERTHDSINDIVKPIVKMGIDFHDMSKETCQEHTIRIADRCNEEDGPDSRARGDRFYHNRRSIDRGNEKADPEKDPRARVAMGDEEGNRIEIRRPGRCERGIGVSFV